MTWHGFHHALVVMAELTRAAYVCMFVSAADSTRGLGLRWGPILVGAAAGCGGAFLPLSRGINTLIDGVAWPIQSALVGAAVYHLGTLSGGSPEVLHAAVAVFFVSCALVQTSLGPHFNPLTPLHKALYWVTHIKQRRELNVLSKGTKGPGRDYALMALMCLIVALTWLVRLAGQGSEFDLDLHEQQQRLKPEGLAKDAATLGDAVHVQPVVQSLTRADTSGMTTPPAVVVTPSEGLKHPVTSDESNEADGTAAAGFNDKADGTTAAASNAKRKGIHFGRGKDEREHHQARDTTESSSRKRTAAPASHAVPGSSSSNVSSAGEPDAQEQPTIQRDTPEPSPDQQRFTPGSGGGKEQTPGAIGGEQGSSAEGTAEHDSHRLRRRKEEQAGARADKKASGAAATEKDGGAAAVNVGRDADAHPALRWVWFSLPSCSYQLLVTHSCFALCCL
ncbi:unnamed protein product [Chrysoparadoxa australica]